MIRVFGLTTVVLVCLNTAALTEGYNPILKGQIAQCHKDKADSCLNAGIAFREGKETKEDQKLAMMFLQKACELRNGRGCSLAASGFHYGWGVERDIFLVVEFHEKACDLDDAWGCYALGLHFQDGDGVRLNFESALDYFGKACDLKEEAGCKAYADLYKSIGRN